MFRIIGLLMIVLCFSVTSAVAAASPTKTQITEAIDLVLQEQRQMITDKLQLTDEEKARFWPEYERYESEMRVIVEDLSDLMGRLAAESEPLSAQEAEALIDKLYTTKNSSIEINREYSQKFRTILPPKKLAIFITILFWL